MITWEVVMSRLGKLLLVGVASVILVAGVVYTHNSARAATSGAVAYTFVAYGDFRPGDGSPSAAYPAGWQHTAARMGTIPHAFDIVAGDMVQGLSGSDTAANDLAKYDNLLKNLGPDASLPHVWTPGNHENFDSAAYRQAYEQMLGKDHWRAYSYGDGTAERPRVAVLALSTEEPGLVNRIGYYGESDQRNSTQAAWLVSYLKAHGGDAHTFIVALFHRPLADPKDGESNPERAALEGLFTKYGVDLVVNAHVHGYVRHMMPDGTPYLIDGNAGATLYDETVYQHTTPGTDAKKVFHKYGFVQFDVRTDDTMTGTTWAADPSTWAWSVADTFTVPQQLPAVSSPTPTPTTTPTPTPSPTPTGRLISEGRRAKASSSGSGHGARRANDGLMATRWVAARSRFPQWWRVDLGRMRRVGAVDVAFYDRAAAPRDYVYRVQRSRTGHHWRRWTAGSRARYIRIIVTGLRSGSGKAAIVEAKVYAVAR